MSSGEIPENDDPAPHWARDPPPAYYREVWCATDLCCIACRLPLVSLDRSVPPRLFCYNPYCERRWLTCPWTYWGRLCLREQRFFESVQLRGNHVPLERFLRVCHLMHSPPPTCTATSTCPPPPARPPSTPAAAQSDATRK